MERDKLKNQARDMLRIYAESIADDLFASGNGEEAERLVLTSADGRDLGGWCKGAVADRIEAYLLARFFG